MTHLNSRIKSINRHEDVYICSLWSKVNTTVCLVYIQTTTTIHRLLFEGCRQAEENVYMYIYRTINDKMLQWFDRSKKGQQKKGKHTEKCEMILTNG